MKQIIIGVVTGILCMLLYNEYIKPVESPSIGGSQVIQEQLKNVSKLIVTEGYFSDIITYKDAKSYYLDLLSAEKKAVVLVKAKTTIAYDLKQLVFDVDDVEKRITISNIPKPELQISPTLTYYDVQQDYLNPFKANDYNKISELVNKRLKKQISESTFESNAQNRLLSELHALFSNTPLNGWVIIVNDEWKNELIFPKEGVISE